MVSYVLLIVIAITLSLLLYNFLKLYVPKEKPECKEGISIAIKEYICEDNEIKISYINTGRFSINGAYVRIGNPNKEYREEITVQEKYGNKNLWLFPIDKLKPQDTYQVIYNIEDAIDGFGEQSGNNRYSLNIEIQPFVYTRGTDTEEIALCTPINQNLECIPK